MTNENTNSKNNSNIDQENDKYIQDTFDKKRPITENTDDTIKIATKIESFSSDGEGDDNDDDDEDDANKAKVFGSEKDRTHMTQFWTTKNRNKTKKNRIFFE